MIYGTEIDGQYQEQDLTGWKEVVKPAYDPEYQQLTGPTLSADETQYVYGVEDLPVTLLAQKVSSLVAQTRRTTLETIVNGAGVGQAYERNIKAADLVLAGSGSTFMWAGMTAEQYASDMGAKVSMTASEWSTWVVDLNTTESLRGSLVEQQYLEFKAAVAQCQSSALIVQYPVMYATRAAALLAAEYPGTVTLTAVPLV